MHIWFPEMAQLQNICLFAFSNNFLTSSFQDVWQVFLAMLGQEIEDADHEKGKYTLIRDPEDIQTGIYDKPLPFYGCGIGWFS